MPLWNRCSILRSKTYNLNSATIIHFSVQFFSLLFIFVHRISRTSAIKLIRVVSVDDWMLQRDGVYKVRESCQSNVSRSLAVYAMCLYYFCIGIKHVCMQHSTVVELLWTVMNGEWWMVYAACETRTKMPNAPCMRSLSVCLCDMWMYSCALYNRSQWIIR